MADDDADKNVPRPRGALTHAEAVALTVLFAKRGGSHPGQTPQDAILRVLLSMDAELAALAHRPSGYTPQGARW